MWLFPFDSREKLGTGEANAWLSRETQLLGSRIRLASRDLDLPQCFFLMRPEITVEVLKGKQECWAGKKEEVELGGI